MDRVSGVNAITVVISIVPNGRSSRMITCGVRDSLRCCLYPFIQPKELTVGCCTSSALETKVKHTGLVQPLRAEAQQECDAKLVTLVCQLLSG